MSEYRETTTVEEITLPEPEPVVTLAELVGRIDWNVSSSNLHDLNQPLSDRSETKMEATHLNLEDPSVSSLLSSEVITIPLSKANEISGRLKNLVSGGSAADILQLGRHLTIERQERLLGSSLNILRESCIQAGFDEVKLHPKEGILVALESGTTHRAVIEIAKAARGQVGVKFDMDGFHGDACIDRTDLICRHSTDRGLPLAITERERKDGAGVGGRGNSLPKRIQLGQS